MEKAAYLKANEEKFRYIYKNHMLPGVNEKYKSDLILQYIELLNRLDSKALYLPLPNKIIGNTLVLAQY